jgi:REP element-mobilizing transposase RayT
MPDFERKQLPHGVPNWVADGAVYFVTINCRIRGEDQLTTKSKSEAIFEAFRHYESLGKWHVRLCLLMPDHLHALISFNTREYSMSSIIRSFKGYLAKEQQIDWQKNYFDHRLRNDAALEEKAQYIRLNPVRAGLVEQAAKWPYLIEPEA